MASPGMTGATDGVAPVDAKTAATLDDASHGAPGLESGSNTSGSTSLPLQAETPNTNAGPSPETGTADTVDKDAAKPASPPPLPDEPLPEDAQDDDGWDPVWSAEHGAWYFYNRFTGQTQWDNPRVDSAGGAPAARLEGGYNPAVHGDYDPTAWYATGGVDPDAEVVEEALSDEAIAAAAAAAAAAIQSADPASFRRDEFDVHEGAPRYSREAKAGRQLNAFFDEAAMTSAHDGRSLKAERSGIKPSRAELKAFKEKRRARKEEKRRAWLLN